MRIGKWLIMIGVTICAVGLMAFFPEYAAKRVDADMLGKVLTYEQEQTETMNQGLSVLDKLRILIQGLSEGNQTYVLNRNNLDNLDDLDKKLVPQLKQQIVNLEKEKLIPNIDGLLDAQWQYESVILNAYTSGQYLGKVLYVWDLNISIPDYGVMTVCVDASTYVIYNYSFQAESGREEMESVFADFLSCNEGVKDTGQYMNTWMQKYMQYLGENVTEATWKIDAYGYEDAEQEAWPMDLEQATGVIVSLVGEPYFATYLYVDVQNKIFGFVPNTEYAGYSNESEAADVTGEINIEMVP